MIRRSVTLTVNGVEYAGWDRVRVELSVERIAGRFELTVTDRWRGQDVRRPIRPQDRCEVLIDGETVITGFVDERSVEYDRDSHTITVTGRDATGQAVDCTTPTLQYRGQTLAQLAEAVCEPFGIRVVDEAHAADPFRMADAEPGMTAFEFLEYAARHRGVMLVSDGAGGLLLTTPSSRRAPADLELGVNIEGCSASASMLDRYSDYTVIGQAAEGDEFHGEQASQAHASARDQGVRRLHRPLTIHAEGGEVDLQKRANWERNVRAGKSTPATYTVSGWKAAGELWRPNRRMKVTDPLNDLDRAERLIAGTTFILDDQGQRTELRLLAPGAFDLLAEPEPEGDA